jgi:hypothetical protein
MHRGHPRRARGITGATAPSPGARHAPRPPPPGTRDHWRNGTLAGRAACSAATPAGITGARYRDRPPPQPADFLAGQRPFPPAKPHPLFPTAIKDRGIVAFSLRKYSLPYPYGPHTPAHPGYSPPHLLFPVLNPTMPQSLIPQGFQSGLFRNEKAFPMTEIRTAEPSPPTRWRSCHESGRIGPVVTLRRGLTMTEKF